MLSFDEAAQLAAWVNTHNGGVPQPRATVAEPVPGRFAVDILSLSLVTWGGGSRHEIDAERVYSRQRAAQVLGY